MHQKLFGDLVSDANEAEFLGDDGARPDRTTMMSVYWTRQQQFWLKDSLMICGVAYRKALYGNEVEAGKTK